MAKIIVQEQQESSSWKDLKSFEGQNDAKKFIKSIISSNCDNGIGLLWRHEPDKLRIIMPIAHCKTEVVFIDDLNDEVKPEDEENEKDENKVYVGKHDSSIKVKLSNEEKSSTQPDKIDNKKDENKIDKKKTGKIKNLNTPKKKENKKAKKSKNTGKSYDEEKLTLLFFERCCELKRWAKTTDFSVFKNEENYPTWSTFHNYLGGITNAVDRVAQKLKNDKLPKDYQKVADKYFEPNNSGVYILKLFNKGTKKDGTTKSISFASLNL